jgi:hypothetical protein
MPGRTTAAFDTNLSRRQIKFVVESSDGAGKQLVESGGCLHAIARIIHVSLRLKEQDLLVVQVAFGYEPLESLPPGVETIMRRNGIDSHEADVVALPGHAGLRVAKADPE